MPRRAPRPLTLIGHAAALATAGAVVHAHAAAASDCHVFIEHANGSLERRATVGEVDRRAVPALHRLLNRGPHDVRATFDRLEPRVLQQGQAEPARGRLPAPVTLLSLECMPTRAAPAAGAPATPALLP